ncbi:MAG: substrate-binding domain-containing protein, partial [Clostridia bacterium]|nr:substrate-binding domain-containing protein [Clostridia bacterium]
LETPPDAVFCDYDQMAIGAIAAIHEAGLRIPQDIAILGFDDTTVARYIEGGISTIGSPFKDMIDIAISVLLKREKNRRSARQQIALRPKLIPRHTT